MNPHSVHPEFDWLFSDLFQRRLAFEKSRQNVFWSRQIRTFEVNPKVVEHWTTHIRIFREALVNPADAPLKVADEIPVTCPDFDAALFDYIAEVFAVVRLRAAGFDSFQILLRHKDKKTPDFRASRRGQLAAVEIKNLRAHDCVERVLPNLFYDRKLKGLDVNGIRLVVRRSFRDTLNGREKAKLAKVVDRIMDYPRGQVLSEPLSNRAYANFEITKGDGDAACIDSISVSDLTRGESVYEGLLRKISADVQSAIDQIYAPVVADCAVRVVAMRWDIPWVSLPIPAHLGSLVRSVFDNELRILGKSAELLIFSDYETYVLTSTLLE